jgi:hypothetical protein
LYGSVINTIHLSQNKKWHVTRKPKLQFEILACLVLHGKLSKGMIESLLKHRNHADIIYAFNKLEDKRLIKKSEIYNPFARGRRQYSYEITYDGLKLLITYDAHPLKFWKTLIGYCHHYDEGLTLKQVEEFYDLFREKYMKYKNHGFSFQLDIFDNMCHDWLDNIILKTGKPSIEQKVIEILAIHRGLTFKELVRKSGAREQELNKCLSTYTLKSYKPPADKTVYLYQGVIGKRYNKKYWDFLLHSVITSKQNSKDGKKTYELSLFGVILALFLVRYYDMDKLKQGLHCNDISFIDYYDKIAYNYQDKLPLIFGKWKLLKDVLKLFSAYNFDVILSMEMRLRDSDKFSITRGGNKELYDSIKEIKMATRLQLDHIANAGRLVWPIHIPNVPNSYYIPDVQDGDYLVKNGINFHDNPNLEKINVVSQKLYEIILSLNPLEYGFYGSFSLEPEIIEKISSQLEKEFADEITAFYYFHLCFDYQFDTRVERPRKYSSSVKHSNDRLPIYTTPKSCLLSVLQNDKENPSISEWYYKWMNDINNLQKDVYETSQLMTREVKYLAKPIMY